MDDRAELVLVHAVAELHDHCLGQSGRRDRRLGSCEDDHTARPATVSFEHGCGRVLFSSYHTEPFSNDLTPQERALLGVLLEASVCNDSPTGVVVN